MYETKVKQMEDVKEIESCFDCSLLFPSTASGYSSEEIVERYQLIMSKFDEMINDLFLSDSKSDKNEIKKKINEFVDFLIEKVKEDPLYLVIIGEFLGIDVENLTKEEVFVYVIRLLRDFYKNKYFLENKIEPDYNYVLEKRFPLILNKSNRKTIINCIKVMPYIEQKFEKILNMDEDLYQEFANRVSEFYVDFLKVLQSRLRESFDEYTLRYSYIAKYVEQQLNKFLFTLGIKNEKGQIELFSFDDYEKVNVLLNFLKKYNEKEEISIKEISRRTADVVDFFVKDCLTHEDSCSSSDFKIMCRELFCLLDGFVKKEIKYNKTNVNVSKYFFFDEIIFKEYYHNSFFFYFDIYRKICIKQKGKIKKIITLNLNEQDIHIVLYFNNEEPKKIEILRSKDPILDHIKFKKEDETIINNKTKFYSILFKKLLQILNNTEDCTLAYKAKIWSCKISIHNSREKEWYLPYLITPSCKIFPFDLVNDTQEVIEKLLALFKSVLYNVNREPIIYSNLEQIKINFEKYFSENISPTNFVALMELIPSSLDLKDIFLKFIRLLKLFFRNTLVKTSNLKDVYDKYIIYRYLNLNKLNISEQVQFSIQLTYFYILYLEKIIDIVCNIIVIQCLLNI